MQDLATDVRAVDRWLRPGKGTPPALNPLEGRPTRTLNPKRVLIVEDDLDSARSMYLLVQDMGHVADYVINGYVAVDYVRRFRPDVVLLDLGLPDMDGFEVCSRIKQDPELKQVRVIVITGYAQEQHRARSKAVGCELHLLKPVPARVIEQILD
jgi:two-component system CheB/CheR fusion protein